jgi:signal transduction histidine kinase
MNEEMSEERIPRGAGPAPALNGAAAAAATEDPLRVITAVRALVSCQDLAELAAAAALLPDKLLPVSEGLVLLRSAEGDFVGRHPRTGTALEKWAFDLLGGGPLSGPVSTGNQLAVGIQSREPGVVGVLAVDIGAGGRDEAGRRLTELAQLIATCGSQLMTQRRAARALKDAQASLGKGLHDLRTPLNSLRLGMHLLQPGLAGQDPAIVQRTHRAVDRMATLVTEMFDALHKN